MSTNEITPVPSRKKARIPELEPAFGELRADYDHRRVQAEFFKLVYFHAQPDDIETYLRSMHAMWMGSDACSEATPEERRRRTEVINDLCRMVSVAAKNVHHAKQS